MSDNYGIQGANSVSAKNMVVGPGGRITVTESGSSVDGLLRQLLEKVHAYEGPADVREELERAAGEVQEELTRPERDRGKLQDRLETITAAAGSTSAVAGAATALAEALGRLL